MQLERRLHLLTLRKKLHAYKTVSQLKLHFSTETVIASVQAASYRDVDIAVSAAQKALTAPYWNRFSGTDRGKLLSTLADLIESQKEILASIEAWDTGEP